MSHYVYIILCKDGSFYTGYTQSIESRIRLHREGKGAKYMKMHAPKKLVYVEKMDSRSDAMRRERQIKKLTHRQKFDLINSNNRTFHQSSTSREK